MMRRLGELALCAVAVLVWILGLPVAFVVGAHRVMREWSRAATAIAYYYGLGEKRIKRRRKQAYERDMARLRAKFPAPRSVTVRCAAPPERGGTHGS